MPYWDTGPGTQSLLWILCSKEAASSQKRYQRTRWGKVWSGCLQVYVFSCWAHVWGTSSFTTEEFTCCCGSFSHPGQVRPADLSTFSVPIPLSFLQRWVLPMCNTFKAVSVQKPTKQRKCWVCLTAVCDSPYLVDILLEIPISNFPTCLLWIQVCIYSKLVLCMHKTKINIEFCIHGVETQDFLMHPFGKDTSREVVPQADILDKKGASSWDLLSPLRPCIWFERGVLQGKAASQGQSQPWALAGSWVTMFVA